MSTEQGRIKSTFEQVPIESFDRQRYMRNPVHFKLANIDEQASKVCTDFILNLPDDLKKRLNNPGPMVNMNGIGFPIPRDNYYVLQNSDQYRRFIVDLYNALLAAGAHEPRLLISNHMYPIDCQQFLPNPNLKLKDDTRVSRFVLDKFFYALLSFEPRIRIKAKKMSTPGFPWHDINGGRIVASKAKIDFKNATLAYGYSKKDYSAYKKGLKPIVKKSCDYFVNGDFKLTSENVEDLLMNGCIPTICSGYRTNNLPTPFIDGFYKYGDPIISKDRAASIPLGEFGALSFMIDNQSFYMMAREATGQFLGLGRKRVINIENFIAAVARQAYSQSFISGIEDSKYGFLSVNNKVQARFAKFITSKLDGESFLFFTGDRSDNDAFLTANIDLIKSLFPSEFSDYAGRTFKSLRCTLGKMHFIEGMLSGIPETTLCNVLGSLLIFYPLFFEKIFNIHQDQFVDAYSDMLINDDDYITIKGIKIFVPLPTDNIPLIMLGKSDEIDRLKKKLDSIKGWMESGKVSYSYSTSGMQEFGVDVSDSGLSIAQKSIISKLFFFEQGGFLERDCFKIYSRVLMLDKELFKTADRVFKKHFNKSLNSYEDQALSFLKILDQIQVDLSEFISEHSPSENLLLNAMQKYFDIGEGVRPSFMLDSSLLDESFYATSLNGFKAMKDRFISRFKLTKEDMRVNTKKQENLLKS